MPPLPPEDPHPGSLKYIDGSFAGERFPAWGDSLGNLGRLTVLRITPAKNEHLPKDPILIKKGIHNKLGADIEGAFPEAKGEFYVLKVRNKEHVTSLKGMTQFCGVNVTVEEHPILNFAKCIVSCENVKHYTDTDLKDELTEQGITEVKQFTRKVNGVVTPTGTMLLTVNGLIPPSHVYFGYNRCKTRPYYPAPMMCFSCYEFGHTSKRCQSKSIICGTCSGDHTVEQGIPCNRGKFCSRCNSSEHTLSSKKCPDYLREDKIQHLRVDHNLSYQDAKTRYEQENPEISFATVAKIGNEQKLNELSIKLDALLVEIGRKDARIVVLTEENRKLQDSIRTQNENLRKENKDLRNTINNLNATIKQMTISFQPMLSNPESPQPSNYTKQELNNQPQQHPGKISRKQASALRKTLRNQEEMEAMKNGNHTDAGEGASYTAAHKKLQRTGSLTVPTEYTEIIEEIIIPMEDSSNISSGEEDTFDKEL